MVVALSLSESAIEVSCLINYTHNSVFSCGFSLSRKPILAIAPRRKKQSRITTRSALSDGGGIVLDKEFEFKPSFDEYLKAMEFVKTDRDSNNNNHSGNSPRKKKIIKKIVRDEENGNDEATTVQEHSSKRGFNKKIAFVEEDLRKGSFHDKTALEKVEEKQNRTSTILTRKKRHTSESEFLDSERAAFKSLEFEDVIDKPRVSRLDMEERIQKLAKW